MTRGVTLIEILVVLTILALAAALAWPPARNIRDRFLVARAVNDVRGFYHQGRLASILAGRRVRLDVAADSLVASFEATAGDSVFLRRPGPASHGVALGVSNPVIRFFVGGIAAGPGNSTLAFGRGAVTDTLVTSRLGRIRRVR